LFPYYIKIHAIVQNKEIYINKKIEIKISEEIEKNPKSNQHYSQPLKIIRSDFKRKSNNKEYCQTLKEVDQISIPLLASVGVL
jgi:hypothetical protein